MKNKLIHYTESPIECLEQRDYSQQYFLQGKPNGLWFSVEGVESISNIYTWKDWCEQEDYCLEALAFSYEIILNEYANILHLKTKKDILWFTKQYNLKNDEEILQFTKQYNLNTKDFETVFDTYNIKWDEVKRWYQGIIISPYQWDCSIDMESCWYHSWECSSGCIWSISCIKEFKLIDDQ